MAADDHAVVVGIRSYAEVPGSRGFDELEASERDALDFEEWLVEPAGGGVPQAHVRRAVTSEQARPGEPHLSQLNALFSPLVTQALAGGRVGRRLYIYLAGHGFSDPLEMDTAALFSADANYFYTPHVAGTHYANWFRRNGSFDEIVLVMDCCRAVNDMTSVLEPPFPKIAVAERARRVRLFYAYATEWGQDTRERSIDGVVRGIFTKALLDALRDGSPNRLGRLTGQRVKDYVHNRIVELMGGTQGAPAPQIQVDNQRDLVFVEKEVGALVPVAFTFAPFTAGMKLAIHDGYGELLDEYEPGGSMLTFALPPGIYKAVVNNSRTLLFEVVGGHVELTL